MKSFDLLTVVIFLSVSSPEILCLLSFHNEINYFSFVVTKTLISSSSAFQQSLAEVPALQYRRWGCDEGGHPLPRLWLCKTP